MNFSEFYAYDPKRQIHKLEESIEEIEKDKIPLDSYLILHSDARLSAEQKKLLSDYCRSLLPTN